MVCLRPAAQQAAVKRLVSRVGGTFVALPGMRLAACPDSLESLRDALRCEAVIFTSPAAVAFASKLLPLRPHMPKLVFAVGNGTARALRRAGVAAITPDIDAMHSEGVLALPQWQDVRGSVGLVTAPGGRNAIAPALRQRGLEVCMALVYQRLPPRPSRLSLQALRRSEAPRAVLVSSAEAIANLLQQLAPEDTARLLDSVAVVSSERLETTARQVGFARVLRAVSPEPARMLQDLVEQVGKAA